MFNDFRLTMIRELANAGLDVGVMQRVMNVVDRIGAEFDVERKETGLVPIYATAQHMLSEYLACKSLEGYSRQTLYNYRVCLSRFLMAMEKQVGEIETNDVRAYLYHYQSARGVSNRTLDKQRITIGGFFRWAQIEGKIDRDPCLAIRPIKYTVKPKPSLSQLELEHLRKRLGDARERAIIEIFYSTGCRVSELCNLKMADVNFDDATLQIFGKGGKYRTGYLNAKAIVALRDYLALREDNSEYLIVSDRKPHGQLKRAAVEKIVRQISERAFSLTGVHITPHIFRHTTISTALRNGMPLQLVSKMAGHSNIQTTMDYAQIDNDDVKHNHARYVI